jgi:alanine racemase
VAQFKRICGATPLGIVVKGNAYGHGILEIAQLVEQHKDLAWLCTAGTQEAVILREHGITKPVLAMAYLDTDPVVAIMHDVAVGVYDLEGVQLLSAAAVRCNKLARIHIKIDTKMARLGINPAYVADFITQIIKLPGIVIEGLFTHLCDTSNPDLSFTREQLEIFDRAVLVGRSIVNIPMVHALASGSLLFDERYDLVRIGTNLFGSWKSALQQKRFEERYPGISLKPVLQWKTKILQIKTIKAGDTVGYNRAFCATKPLTIAIIPVGYVDGYTRALSHKGDVIVAGQLAPVLGIISMNLTIIDISACPRSVAVGDEVLLLGNHPLVTATAVAERIGTISNELIARLNADIPRIVR